MSTLPISVTEPCPGELPKVTAPSATDLFSLLKKGGLRCVSSSLGREANADRLPVQGFVTVNRDLLKSTEKTSWRDFLPHPEEKNLEFEGEYLQKFVFI